MPATTPRTRIVAGLIMAATTATIALVAVNPTADAAACSDVDVSFARGTGEAAGLGIVGRPFVSSLTANLPGRTVTSYAVNYAANTSQSSAGPGATDMTNHIVAVAAACPNTKFVIGGYSQGATVTDIAVGIRTGTSTGMPIPAALAPRVAAVVVYGNPLGLSNRTIAQASTVYGPRSRDYCNDNDSVCGRYQPNGSGSHLSYSSNGTTSQGAQFAAGLVNASTPNPTPTPTTPVPTPTTPAPTPTPTSPAPATCVRSSTTTHVSEGRAVEWFDRAYAKGSGDALGSESRFNIVSLRSTAPDF